MGALSFPGMVQRTTSSSSPVVLLYAVAVVAADAGSLFVGVETELAYYAVLLAAMLNHYSFGRLSTVAQNALLVLALIPLVKIAAFTSPQNDIPDTYSEVLPAGVGLLALVSLCGLAGTTLLPWTPRSRTGWLTQILVALVGPLLALFATSGIACAPPEPRASEGYIAVVIVGFSGLAHELIFRGAIQPKLVALFGPSGVGITSILYASVFVATGSGAVVVLALVTGLFWGVIAAATRSLSGVVASHVLFAMTWSAGFVA